MAEKKKKTQAQKAVSDSKEKTSKPPANKDENSQLAMNLDNGLPVRLIAGVACIIAFVLLVIVFFRPEGALIVFIRDLICGLIGKIGLFALTWGLLFAGVVLVSSRGRPVMGRCICMGVFVACCGCIHHLLLDPPEYGSFFDMIVVFYTGGAAGTTGGLFCGLLAQLFQWVIGTVISVIVLSVCGILFALAAFRITIPGILHAIQSRPRGDWETEYREPKPDPAEVVVHKIATKRIEYHQQKRRAESEKETKKTSAKKSNDKSKVSHLILQIAGDVETPVLAAGTASAVEPEDEQLQEETVEPVDEAPVQEPEIPEKPEETAEVLPAQEPAEEVESEPEPEVDLGPEILICKSHSTKSAPAIIIPDIPVEEPPQKVTAKEARTAAVEVAIEIAQAEETKREYCYPPIDLLKLPRSGAADGTQEMKENSRRLNETLASFKIDAHIVNVTRGPSVTRYEVELEKGVRLNKLTSAADDIALNLGASGVRIAAVPDKISVVGIEVPNKSVTTVSLREVIDSKEFKDAKSRSTFSVGKDIGGSCIVGNIDKLPHMLIAGTTGSGKSVCMNSIIISLLYKASPDDVKLIMVDPKMVELGIYNGIPHLLIPVVTDPKKAAGSLQWAVTEMLRRYRAMSDLGVRDLESYNSIVASQELEGEKLPQVVVIIDELADLMLVAAKEVEESICRIAQMGRAAGIHLIIATQRPSADVITGLMKANIPSRIAFSVASAMESRIILDTQGAEKLVGRGDMLFAPIGTGKPQRVQGCFVSDDEVEAVASYIKEHYNTNYDESVLEEIEKKAAQTGNPKNASVTPEPNAEELDGDEMLPQAVDVILETGQASVSMLQRRLKLGYARAARIVDEMEEKGIVGPFQGSKPRAILITKAQWDAMRGGQSAQMDFDDLELNEPVPEAID